MVNIKIKYFTDDIEKLKYIDGKSDMIYLRAAEDVTIHKNDRICQFRIVRNQPEITFCEVKELDGKDRGGFGSTGK